MSITPMPPPALAARVGALILLLLAAQMPVAAQSITYIHTDALGTPVATTDSDRNVVEVSEYEPYGKLLNRSLTDAPGFTGHVSDAATGLSYMQQRYYDPVIGRFLSVDPVAANRKTGSNFNRYEYAANNPYRFRDPDGRYKCSGDDCAKVRNALNRVRSALHGSAIRIGEARGQINQVLSFYGRADTENGVTVSTSGTGTVGGAAPGRTPDGRVVAVKIEINMDRLNAAADDYSISRQTALSAVLMHEGQHGVDFKDRAIGAPESEDQEMSIERRGSRTEAATWQLLQTDAWKESKIWTNQNGINEDAIEQQATRSTTIWCAQRCD